MRTAKQQAASRANGKKSAGPVTSEGKANSRYNALKNGIYAEAQVMFAETAEDLAAFTAEMHAQYTPASPAARFLVDTLIHNEWRLRRFRNVEASLWARAREIYLFNYERKEKLPLGDVYVLIAPDLDRLQRQVNACERNYHKALKELHRIQAEVAQSQPIATPAPEATQSGAPQAKESTPVSASSGSFLQTAPAPAPATPAPAPQPAAPAQTHAATL